MIVRRQYVLEESCSGKDLDRGIPWTATVRKGMRLSMSMVFTGYGFDSACPRCNTETSAIAGTNTQWYVGHSSIQFGQSAKLSFKYKQKLPDVVPSRGICQRSWFS